MRNGQNTTSKGRCNGQIQFNCSTQSTPLPFRQCCNHKSSHFQCDFQQPASGPTSLYCWTQSRPDDPRQGGVCREWHVLYKDCNAVLDHLSSPLRASREAVVRGVAPLGKDAPLPARRASCKTWMTGVIVFVSVARSAGMKRTPKMPAHGSKDTAFFSPTDARHAASARRESLVRARSYVDSFGVGAHRPSGWAPASIFIELPAIHSETKLS